ncbi:MAG: thioredoxin family protein [Bacteroidia bacterium]|nr:thioredoxin family protein [Bacteroidia bacterium]NND53286.1 thioredoxin fold domain-containing protein [Flavobacteriaceae bacterium]
MKLKILAILFFLGSFNLAQAQDNSKSYNLLVFEGSDWCANCIRFNTNVTSDSVFNHFLSEKNINLEFIDFPQRKTLEKSVRDYNASVAEKYNFKGVFPTIILIDRRTDEYTFLNYSNENPKEFIALIASKM